VEGQGGAPWPWEMARWCLDFETGRALHFPAGTYRAQVATEAGRIELEMMDLVRRVWRMATTDVEKWEPDGDEIRLRKWLLDG